jgi:penicillin-binding protein 1A
MRETPPTPERPVRPLWQRLLRWLAWSAGALALAAAVGGGVLAWLYHRHVVEEPGAHLERSHILAVVAQESPVYYRDGTTRIGVFFEDEHREFVSFDDLPPSYVAAIVAAEDGTFWSHPGVSPKHIARAVRDNLAAGRTVSGGSTLTQQTAKNLYYRPDRSLRSKWQELVNALRLEAHYDKTDILTFYVNQFHVSGNGRGLGIAVRYFFDEDVADLRQRDADEAAGADLLKSAFLAGLVKGPGYYDPFLGDAERQDRARARAHDRTRYVLQRIVAEPAENLVGPWPVAGARSEAEAERRRLEQVRGWKAEAARLLEEGFELPFQRGRFRYDSNAVLDEVRRRLGEPPFAEVLREAEIDDPDSAGLEVITTLDPAAQREAIYGLWHHLTEVGTWLEGLEARDFVRADSRGPRFDPQHAPEPHTFRLARVVGHPEVEGRTTLDLDLGGVPCRVDRDGLVRVALAVQRGRAKNPYVKVPGTEVDAFAAALEDGAVVWVSVRRVPDEGPALCDLEVRPELQGAVVALEEGQVRAMVGGNDNRNFNRATALRQFGSTWKPLVYHAALELGWRPDDPLDNERNVFPFSTTVYYPRPDHEPEPVVSMAWAGVKSENLASIWLLYHLVDKLDGDRIRALAAALDLARREGEDDTAYRRRIQEAGVLPTRGRLKESTFLKARQDALAGLSLSGHPEDRLALSSLLYGWGYARERERVARLGPRARTRAARALDNSWVHLEPLLEPCRRQHDVLMEAVAQDRPPLPDEVPDLSVRVEDERVTVACGAIPEGYVAPDRDGLGPALSPPLAVPVPGDVGADRVGPDAGALPGVPGGGARAPEPARPADSEEGLGRRLKRWLGLGEDAGDDLPDGPPEDLRLPVSDWEDVLIDDRLHVETLRAVQASITRREALLAASGDVDLYAPEHLYWHQDFRVLLAMEYVAALARQYGVRSPIRSVLSLPLGASEITLEEATSVYAGLTSGQGWRFPGRARPAGALLAGSPVATPPSPSLLIAEIRDVDGHVIYRAEPASREVVEPAVGGMTADILRNVVQHGTGRRARQAVALGGAPVPLGGKTGTTNDFRNAAFVGYVPAWRQGAWRAEEGLTLGVYVGYDDNRPMREGRVILAGASGALPAWTGVAEGVAEAELLGQPDEAPPEDGWRLALPGDLRPVSVDPARGLPVAEASREESRDEGAGDTDAAPMTEASDEGPAIHVPPEPVAAAPAHLSFERVPAPVRVAPSTDQAVQDNAAARRALLEELEARERPSIWDALDGQPGMGDREEAPPPTVP